MESERYMVINESTGESFEATKETCEHIYRLGLQDVIYFEPNK